MRCIAPWFNRTGWLGVKLLLTYIHTTKHLKSHHDVSHHTAISHHRFTPYTSSPRHSAPLHTVDHPGHRHSTSYNISFHITPYNKYISSVVFNSALKTHLFSSGLWLLCLCAWSCVPLVSCVCSGYIPHHKCCSIYVISRVQIAFHITLL